MPVNIIMIPTDESTPISREKVEPGLEVGQKIVGGYLEQLPSRLDEGWVAYGNEEAKLEDLPFNKRAHMLLVRLCGHNPMDPICGPVFLAGFDDEDGSWIDIPSDLWGKVLAVPGMA